MDKIEINKRIDYITTKLKTLKLALIDWEKEEKEFEKYKSLKTVERDCEEIIESATRINQEILSINNKIADSYRESFEMLEKLNLFESKDFLEKLSNSTGFRNRLAHDYINLDEIITIKTGKSILNIYPKYLLKIQDYIEKL